MDKASDTALQPIVAAYADAMAAIARMQRAIGFQVQLARRSAQRIQPVVGGFAVLDDRYPISYEHNQAYVMEATPSGPLIADIEKTFSHLGHRHITVMDDSIGTALVSALTAAGYRHEPLTVMEAAGLPDRPADAGLKVEQMPYAALREAMTANWLDHPARFSPDAARQLFERRFTTAAACDLTSHVVRVDASAVAWCHLYRVDGEAQIEDVVTTPAWRGRGMARAVVLDAVRTAREAGCELVFLVALADDWPWRLYERFGFVRLGQMHLFVRREVPTA